MVRERLAEIPVLDKRIGLVVQAHNEMVERANEWFVNFDECLTALEKRSTEQKVLPLN